MRANIHQAVPTIPSSLMLSAEDIAEFIELSGDQIATLKDRLSRCGECEVKHIIAGNVRVFVLPS